MRGRESRKMTRTGRLAVFACLSVAVCAVTLLTIFFCIFHRGMYTEVVYPDYVGSYEDDIGGSGDIEITKKYVSSEHFPEGVVISQYPEGLSCRKLPHGTRPTLTLSISTGRESFCVPDMCGETLREALITLGGMQCTAEIVRVYDDGAGELPEGGVVTASYPSAGGRVCAGERVMLHVRCKRAQENICMPRLIGLSIADVRDAVSEIGCELRVNGYDVSGERLCDEDTRRVIYQFPPEGAYILRGTAVDVTVNLFESIKLRERGCRRWQKTRQEG